jgi:NACHT domain
VSLNESYIRKSDPILLDRLMHAKEGEVLRVAMTLNVELSESGQTLALPTLDPSQFASRVDYRQALIQQQQTWLTTALGTTMEDLENLSLKTYGGNTSRVIIAEGTAEQIIKSLELVGVHHASFDQSLRLEPAPSCAETLKSAQYLTKIAIEIFSDQKNEYVSDKKLTYWDRVSRIFTGTSQSQRGENIPEPESICQAFEQYIKKYKALYCDLKLLGMRNSVKLESVYTDVRFLNNVDILRFTSRQEMEIAYQELGQRRFKHKLVDPQNGIEVASQRRFLMVLGAPGAGKSTFLRRIGLEALKEHSLIFKHYCIPILIELKRMNKNEVDLEQIIIKEFEAIGFPNAQDFANKALYQGKFLIMLDGLDEVPIINRSKIVKKIKYFGEYYQRNRYVLSCRTAAYQREFDAFTNVTVAEFEDDQIEQFIYNWFQTTVDLQSNTAKKCWDTLQRTEQIGARELAHTPLLLTFLCLVYDRAQTFPINRSILYGKALRILMEEWAAEKKIFQDAIYQGLSTELEEILLSEIAITGFKYSRFFFSKHELIEKIKLFLTNNLNAPGELDGEAVLNAIVVQQGILVEQSDDVYSFSHLSLQEYLVAQYINDNNGIEDLVRDSLIDRRWREVFLLTAGLMKEGADELLLMIEKQAHSYITPSNAKKTQSLVGRLININSPGSFNLQTLLQWADMATANSESDYKPAARRAGAIVFAYYSGVIIARDFDRFRDRNRFRELNRFQNLNRLQDIDKLQDRNYFRELNLLQDIDIGKLLDQILSLTHALDFTLDSTSIRYYAPEFDANNIIDNSLKIVHGHQKTRIFKPQVYEELSANLQSLKNTMPGKNLSYKLQLEYYDRVRYFWIDALQINPKMLQLSDQEIVALENYFHAYEVMVWCKKSALKVSPQVWSDIEGRMIMPIVLKK